MPEVATADGARLHFVVQGNGPSTVICLHALGAAAATWRGFSQGCDLPGVRWVAVDLRGHGESRGTGGAGGSTDLEAVNDVLRVADALGADRFALAGHSVGGKVALAAAARVPARVEALVLLGAVGVPPAPLDPAVVETVLARAHDEAFLREAFAPWFQAWTPAIDAWMAQFARTPGWALRAWLDFALADLTRTIDPLGVPALVLAGDQDPVYGPDYQRSAVLPWLPRAEFATIPACGHGLALERPAEIAAHSADFLRSKLRQEPRRT